MDLAIFLLPGHNNVELLIITHPLVMTLTVEAFSKLWKELLITPRKPPEMITVTCVNERLGKPNKGAHEPA